jgi:hypothetical protein
MQSSKTTKKTAKPAAEVTAASEKKTVKEAAKTTRAPRAAKSDTAVSTTAAAKGHRKAASPISPAVSASVEQPRAMAATATASAVPVSSPVAEPTHEDIAVLAYSYFVARGYEHGYEKQDWERAVAALTQRS